jgi:Cellulose binding domain/Kazal-type serine protease inhibitor domain
MENRTVRAVGIVGIVLGAGLGSFSCSSTDGSMDQTRQSLTTTPITASVAVTSSWSGGYCATVNVTNKTSTTMSGWTVLVQMNASTLTTIWNASSSVASRQLTATSSASTAWLPAGASTEFGFCTSGATGKPSVVSATGMPVTAVPDGLAAKLVISPSSTGYSANVVITNNATTTAWTWAVVVELAQSKVTNVWSASSSVTGTRLRLGPVAQNSVLAPGASTTVGFSATKTGTNYLPSVVSPIEPPRTCGTIAGLTCRAGEYCAIAAGSCQIADAAGVCTTKPTVCTTDVAPVCGCDGNTYSNACQAALAGVNVDHTGECVRKCGGIAGLTCRTGEYCAIAAGSCQIADAAGVCTARGGVCPMDVVPVCGCDGNTYTNACQAALAGVNVDHSGECVPPTCGGTAGLVCRAGEYCAMDVGTCLTPNAAGVCQPMPEECMDVVDPVCGCDGKTYNNACQASMAGTSVASAGACR